MEWNKRIGRTDRRLTLNDTVCSKHFAEEDILTHYEFTLPNGQKEKFRRGKTCLKRGAVPTIFPTENLTMSSRSRQKSKPNSQKGSNSETDEERDSSSVKSGSTRVSASDLSEMDDMFTIDKLHEISQSVQLPGSMWGVHQKPGGKTAFIHINEEMVIDKTVEFVKSCVPKVKVRGHDIDLPEVRSKSHLECLLRGIDAITKLPRGRKRKRRGRPPKSIKLEFDDISVDNKKVLRSTRLKTSSNVKLTSTHQKLTMPEKRVLRNRDKKSVSPPRARRNLRSMRQSEKNTKVQRDKTPRTPRVKIKQEIEEKEESEEEEEEEEESDDNEEDNSTHNKDADTPKQSKTDKPKPMQKQAKLLKESTKKNSISTPTVRREDFTPRFSRQRPKWEREESLTSFGVRCVVECCQNSMLDTRRSNLNIYYYRFPMDDRLAEKWKEKCKIEGRMPKSARVCSDHFKREDFEGAETPGVHMAQPKRNLKSNAIPTLYLSSKREHKPPPQKKRKPRKPRNSVKNDLDIKIVETKSIKRLTPEPADENSDISPPRTPLSVSSSELDNTNVINDSPEIVNTPVVTVELSDESSEESDAYEEVIQVRITNLSATSSAEDSESDEVMRRRRKVLKRKQPQIEETKDYEIETLEIELNSDDSDADVREMKKTLDLHLNNSKSFTPRPPTKIAKVNQNGLHELKTSQNNIKINQSTPTGLKSVHLNITPKEQNENSVVFEVKEAEKSVTPPPSSSAPTQSLAKLLQAKSKPDRETIIKIIEQKICENYEILNNRIVPNLSFKTPEMKNDNVVQYIVKNGKADSLSLPKGIIKHIDKKENRPLPEILVPQAEEKRKDMASPTIKITAPIRSRNTILNETKENMTMVKPDIVEHQPKKSILVETDVSNPHLEMPTTDAIKKDSIEFVSSEDIIIEEASAEEKEKSELSFMEEMDDDNQILIVCRDEDDEEKDKSLHYEPPIHESLQPSERRKDLEHRPQTISIQRKRANEIIPNKIKIPATEHSSSRTEKGILDSFFLNNSSSDNIFGTNDEIEKPSEIQDLLNMVPQNEVDYSKVIVLNHLEDPHNVQWGELSNDSKEHVQNSDLYFIQQEDDVGHTSHSVRDQSSSFDESQYLNMECLEVEVVPPEETADYKK